MRLRVMATRSGRALLSGQAGSLRPNGPAQRGPEQTLSYGLPRSGTQEQPPRWRPSQGAKRPPLASAGGGPPMRRRPRTTKRRPRGARSKLQTPNGTSVGRVDHQSCKRLRRQNGGTHSPRTSHPDSAPSRCAPDPPASRCSCWSRRMRRCCRRATGTRTGYVAMSRKMTPSGSSTRWPHVPAERFGEDDLADLA